MAKWRVIRSEDGSLVVGCPYFYFHYNYIQANISTGKRYVSYLEASSGDEKLIFWPNGKVAEKGMMSQLRAYFKHSLL